MPCKSTKATQFGSVATSKNIVVTDYLWNGDSQPAVLRGSKVLWFKKPTYTLRIRIHMWKPNIRWAQIVQVDNSACRILQEWCVFSPYFCQDMLPAAEGRAVHEYSPGNKNLPQIRKFFFYNWSTWRILMNSTELPMWITLRVASEGWATKDFHLPHAWSIATSLPWSSG